MRSSIKKITFGDRQIDVKDDNIRRSKLCEHFIEIENIIEGMGYDLEEILNIIKYAPSSDIIPVGTESMTDFLKFQKFFNEIGIDYDVVADGVIYLGGLAVDGARLVVLTFYDDGKFQAFKLYPDEEYQIGDYFKKEH